VRERDDNELRPPPGWPGLARCLLLLAAWAGPSVVLAGMAGFDLAGCVLGLVTFLVLIVAVLSTQAMNRAMRKPIVRRAFVDAFNVRGLMLVALPLGLLHDAIVGGAAVAAVEFLIGLNTKTTLGSLAATMLEGGVLCGEYLALARAAYGIRRRSGYMRVPIDTCVECGYDLRGGPSARCPECGAVNPAAVPPA